MTLARARGTRTHVARGGRTLRAGEARASSRAPRTPTFDFATARASHPATPTEPTDRPRSEVDVNPELPLARGTRRFNLSRLAALCLAAACATPVAHARKVIELQAANGQPVTFPYVLRDSMGGAWDVQQDGQIGDGGNDVYDGGGRLVVTGPGGQQQYTSPQATAAFDAARNEVVLGAATFGGITVTRRVTVNAQGGWCRWVETVNNPTAAPAKVQLKLSFDLGSSIQTSQPLVDERKTKKAFAVAVSDGRHHLAMIGGGRGSKLLPRFDPRPGSDQVDVYYDVEVPARQSAAVVHFQVSRRSLADAVAFAEQAKDKDLIGDLPKDVVKQIVNFHRTTDQTVGNLELLRGGVLDVVELRGGDQVRGTLKPTGYALDTAYGPLELPAERVVAMVTAGTFRPMQLFVTADGEVVGGTLRGGDGTVELQLSSGQVTKVPLASVTRMGYRRRPGEPEEWRFDQPAVFLRDGQRIVVDPPAEPLAVASMYGPLTLKAQAVGSIVFHGEDQAVHQVRLTDGSRFAALVNQGAFELRPRTVSAGRAVAFPAASVARLRFAAAPEEPDEDAPTLALANGDLLVGALTGELALETGFDTLRIDAAQVRALRHAGDEDDGAAAAGAPANAPPDAPPPGSPSEVRVTLWDGATLSGRLRGDLLACALRCGASVRVPVGMVDAYRQPNPQPSQDVVDRIRAVAGDLASPDWRRRDRATDALLRFGPGAAAVLKSVRADQPPEGQKAIDALLEQLGHAGKPKPPAAPGAASAPAGGRPEAAHPPQVPRAEDVEVLPDIIEKG